MEVYLASKRWPKINPFFLDGLILFAEARMEQVSVIKNCLEWFFEASGQRVSVSKMRVHCSRNATYNLARRISTNFGTMLTKDLGCYLRVPLFHGQVTKGHLWSNLDNMSERLSGRQVDHLSTASYATLIISE